MGDARMVRLGFKNSIEDRCGILLAGKGRVGVERSHGGLRQSIKDRCLAVARIAIVKCFHCSIVGQRAGLVVELVGGAVKGRDCVDIVFLVLGTYGRGLRLCDSGAASFKFGQARRRPQWVVKAHRSPPVGNAARRVGESGLIEAAFGLLIFERVKPCDTAQEDRLRSRAAACFEANVTKLFGMAAVLLMAGLSKYQSGD
ncbi:MAG: hypothetical protein H0T82_11335 [Sphingomonas sp.]|nr:hypothetical protein [Sphingomonas sp.]